MTRKVYDEDLAAGGRLGIFLDSGSTNPWQNIYGFKFEEILHTAKAAFFEQPTIVAIS